jgi:2-polyprenyl-3-methyl-5-hydroxy-6-metoxy-1,4-benzoquinol methylase
VTELPEPKSIAQQYDQAYFAQRCGPVPYDREHSSWLEFFGNIADELIRRLGPQNALDVGCAKGFLVEAFRDRGVNCEGFDISDYAISQVRADIAEYCRIGSVTDPIEGHYDLISCIEVLEHVPEADAISAVRSMTSHTETILFSSTPSDFTEPTHVNVQPIIYWLKLFREFEFGPDLVFDAAFVCPQAMLFRKQPVTPSDEVLSIYALTINQKIELRDRNAELLTLRQEQTTQAAELSRLSSLLAEREEALQAKADRLNRLEKLIERLSLTAEQKEEITRSLSSTTEGKDQPGPL